VRFDPRRNLLLAARALTVTATLAPAADAAPAKRGLARTALSTSPLDGAEDHTYLVISTSNLLYNAPAPWNLQTLCDARARAGFTPVMVPVEWICANYPGTNTPARIRAFIQDAYQQWGVRYLLIAGTYDLIPVQKLYVSFKDFFVTRTADIPAEAIYYGCMTGSFDQNGNGLYGEVTDGENGGDVDLTAEVMVGRFPVADPTELAHLVRKTLSHETAGAEALRPNALLAEKMDMGTLVYATGYMEQLRWGSTAYNLNTLGFENSPYAEAFDTDHTLYDSDAGLWTSAQALDFLNRDYQTVNHIGHGAVKVCAKIQLSLPSHLEALRAFTNTVPYFMYSQACNTGAFDTPDCFAEQLVTVSNAACATVMNAREGWEYLDVVGGYSHRFHRAFWDAALRGNATRLGEINEQSRRMNLHMLTSYAPTYWRWVYYELNLFGDPALPFARAVNTVAPLITHEPLVNTYDTQATHRVACTLEPAGLYDPQAVALVWQTDREPGLVRTQAMTQVAGTLFEAHLPAQAAKTRIGYSLRADSHAGVSGVWPKTGETAFYVTERLDLDVRGSPLDYGEVSPAYGISHFPSGQVVVATAPETVPAGDDTRFLNTGFFGTGSVPQSGTNRTVTFQMDGHSLLVWAWQRQHRLTLAAAPALFPTQTFWTAENSACPVPTAPQTFTNGTPHTFAEWRRDGARVPAAPGYSAPALGSLVMDAPHTLEARYLPTSQDADGNALPDWWELRYFGANGQDPASDTDHDGYTLAEEYADRANPLLSDEIPSPPLVSHAALAETQSVPGPFALRASITDTHDVARAVVRWHRRTEPWQETPMAVTSNTLFEAQIGAFSAPGDDFEYQIIAADPSGNTASTPVYFFYLRYPVADFSRFHDLELVGQTTQWITSAYMDLHNAGNADLVWTLRFARVESVLSTNLTAWGLGSLGQPWEVSTNRCASAPYALHSRLLSTGQVNTPVRSSVTFPPTLLGANAVLSFRHWIQAEVYGSTTRAFDGGIVEFSLDNGATFQQLRGPYTHTIYGWGASPWAEGTPCFAGKGTEGWQTVTFDLYALYPELNGFNGRTVLFRFHYGGDNNTDLEGWFIDDVTVSPLYAQNGFAHNIEPSYSYVIPAGGYRRILWSNLPSSMALRNDNLSVLITSNDPVAPLFSFYWQFKMRDAPLLPGLGAAQLATGDGRVALSTGVFDRDGVPVTLAAQWSPDSGKHWFPAALTNLTASLGTVQSGTATGDVANLTTLAGPRPATNQLGAVWLSRDILPAITVNTQMRFRVTAHNGYFGAAYTTPLFSVDNVPPSFLPGALAFAPLRAAGPYAVTPDALPVSWPPATDAPFTNLAYRLRVSGDPVLTPLTQVTVPLAGRLDATHTFELVALDHVGNASEPLGASLLVLDALGDYDADGMSTADEEVAGTSATDAADRLAASCTAAAGTLNLSWPSVTGRLYTVQTSPTLSPPAWQPLPGWTDIPGTGHPLALSIPQTSSNGFFRIRVRMP
jgi:hypothetical protein